MRVGSGCLGLVAVLVLIPCLARAGGFEHPDNGTVPLGRAGAWVARSSDGTAFQYNIAGLAAQRGTNLTLLSNFTDLNYCFTRSGSYPSGTPGLPQTEVAYSQAGPMCDQYSMWSGLGPLIAISTDLGRRNFPVFGLGIYGPSAPTKTGFSQRGEDSENPALVHFEVNDRDRTTYAPNRFDLVDDELTVIYFAPSVAWEPWPGLRVGASFQWVLSHFKFLNYGVLDRNAPSGPTARNELDVLDAFSPAFMVGAQYRVGRNMDVGISFRWASPLTAEGDLAVKTTSIDSDTGREVVGQSDTVSAELDVGQASQLRAGLRFFWPRPRSQSDVSRPYDPMRDEVFDAEIDYVLETNSAIEFLTVRSAEEMMLCGDDGPDQDSDPDCLAAPPVGEFGVPHMYKDTHSVRVGGDWNFLPGRATARIGFSYESTSSPLRFTVLDFAPFRRLGAHVGATVRLGPVDVSLAYAHLFQPDRTVTDGGGRVAGPGGLCDPDSLDEEEAAACVVNNGRFESSYDIVSIGTQWHF